jgi:hypothetical protein
MTGKMNTRRAGKSGKKEEAGKGKETGTVELVLEEESDDDLPDLSPRGEDDILETAAAVCAKASKAADCAGESFFVFN